MASDSVLPVLHPITATVASGTWPASTHAKPTSMIAENGHSPSQGSSTPKAFTSHEYALLCTLCQEIITPDNRSGGAIEAGAPEFIDLLASERPDYRFRLGGGLLWLDATCRRRYGASYLDCPPEQRSQILDLIAYRESAKQAPEMSPGTPFFSLLRKLTADAFFTSEIGIRDLEYIGNTHLSDFPGCPPLPEGEPAAERAD